MGFVLEVGAGQGGLPHAYTGEGLAGRLGAGVGQVGGGASVADAAGAGGQVVDGVGQLGADAQAGGQGGVHGAHALGEPAPPGQINDRVRDVGHQDSSDRFQRTEPGSLPTLQKSGARSIRATPEALDPPRDAAHQWEPESHGRRRAKQDQVPAGLGQCGPDESQMPQVRPGRRPLLLRGIDTRTDPEQTRRGAQVGSPR